MENEGKEIQENASDGSIEQEQRVRKRHNILKFVNTTWKILEKIIMVAIIFISLIIVTQRVSNNESSFLGFRIFRVQTGSMIPKYLVGDVILVREKAIDKIAIGDDVTYYGTSGVMKGKLVTHQVINIEMIDGQKTFHTKGIANNLEDPVVYGEQINGVVQCKLHILTLICTLVTNQYVLYFCGILPITIFIFFSFAKADKRKFEE